MSIFGTPVTVKGKVDSSVGGAFTLTCNTALNDLIIIHIITNGNSPSITALTDTIGNTYTIVPNAFQGDANGTRQRTYYCLNSIGANAANVVTYNIPINGTPIAMFIINVPCSTSGVLIDNFTNAAFASNTFTSGTTTTAAFTTTGTDEFVFIGLEMSNHTADTVVHVGSNTVMGTTPPIASTQYAGGNAYQIFSSVQTGITESLTTSTPGTNMVSSIIAVGFKAPPTFSISGNAGTATATVSWTGTSSGSTSADGAGNYSIPGLIAGSYTITPTKVGFAFTPSNSSQTITSSNITGVNFTASGALSISGNAGTCSATVSYTGPSSGSVAANTSGDYTIPSLVPGTYTITPSKATYTFSPVSRSVLLSLVNTTDINFFVVLDPATGVTLTPVYVNTATGANQNPMDPANLDASGSVLFSPFQILSHVAEGTDNTKFAEAFYIGAAPVGNDQYAQFTIHDWVSDGASAAFLTVRVLDNLDEDNYALTLADNGDGVTISISVDAFVANVSTHNYYTDLAAPIPTLCDMFTLVAVGNLLALYRNKTQLFVANAIVHATGGVGISAETPSPNPLTNMTLTNFVFGNASGLLPPPVSANSPWVSPLVRSSIEKGNA